MGIFLDVTAQTSRYFNLPSEDPQRNQNTEEGSSRLANLAGLAIQKNTGTDEPYESIADRSLERINQGDEEGLRQQIDDIAMVEELKRIRETQLEFVRGRIPNAEPGDLTALVDLEANLSNKPSRQFALEREGVAQAQNLGANDPNQEGFFQDEEKFDVLDAAKNNAVFISIFADRLGKLEKERQDQGTLDDVGDIVNLLAPLQSVVDIYGKLGRPKGSNLIELPGTRIQKISNELWASKTPEEFAEKLDGIITSLRETSPGSGQEAKNRASVIQILSQLYGPTDNIKLGINAFAAVDALTTIPVVAVAKVARNPSQLLNVVGNRSGAVNLTTDTLIKEVTGAQPSAVMTPVEAIEESLPTMLRPTEADRIGASISGEVSRKFAGTQKLIDDVEVIRQRRLEPEQEAEAIRQAQEDARKLFGQDKILDMNQTFDPKTSLWTNHIYLGDEYGLPFASREAALESAKRRGLIGDPINQTKALVRTKYGFFTPKDSDRVSKLGDRVEVLEKKGGAEENSPFRGEYERASEEFNQARDEATKSAKNDWRVVDVIKDPENEMGGGEVFAEQNAGTGWTLRIDRHVREDGALPPAIGTKEWGGNSLTEKIRNPAHFLPTLIHSDRVSADIRNSRLAAKLIRPLTKKIEKVAGEGTSTLSKLYKDNQVSETWYDEATFEAEFLRHSGRPATAAEKEAYYVGKQLNDIEHTLRNDWVYEQKAARGTVSVSVDTPGFKLSSRNGREIVNGPDTWNSDIIYDVDNGVRTVPGNNTKRYKDRWDTGNYRLLKVEDSVPTKDGSRAKILFVHKASSEIGPLSRNQLNYNQGPHRHYSNRFYAKQADVEVLEDGTEVFHNPKTHIVGTEKDVQRWALNMESARSAWNDIPDKASPPPHLRKIIDGVYPGGYPKFQEAIEAGKIKTDTPFEVVFDSAMPAYQTKAGAKRTVDWRDTDFSDVEQHAVTHKQMYYSEKGEHLYGADGRLAETLDPYKTMSLAVNNVLYLKSFAAYNDKAVKEWVRSAEGFLIGRYRNPWDAFLNGTLDEKAMSGTDELRTLYNGLTAARQNIQRTMSLNTPGEMRLNTTRAKVATWVEGKFGKAGDRMATALVQKNPGNPVDTLQRATFISAFFADASQIVIQPMTALAATTIHPIHGLKSWTMSPFTLLSYFNKTPNFIDYVAKNAKAAGLIDDVDDYKAMVKTLRDSGWLNVGKEMAEMGTLDHGFVRSGLGVAVKEVERYGTSLVRVAEGVNRMTAFQIAWRDARTQFSNVSPDDPTFLRYLTQKADDLSWNMTRASQRAWQKGAWGLATRFQSYNASMLENMLPAQIFGKKTGGNPRITPEQRARLVLGQWLLFGASGIPGAHLISEGIETAHQYYTGEAMDQDQKRMMTRGMLDTWLYKATGADVATADRVGVGSAIKQLMQSVSGGTFEKSALELAAGPPGRTAMSMLETVSTVLEYFRYEQVEDLGREDFYLGLSMLGNNFAAFNRYEAAYYAWKTGFLLDKRTGRAVVEVNDSEVLAIALGIQPFEVGERYNMILTDDEKSMMAYKMGQQLVKIRRQAIQALEDGDLILQRNINRQVATFMMPFRDDPYMTKEISRVVQELEGDSGTLYEEAIQRLYTKWGTPIPVNKDKQ